MPSHYIKSELTPSICFPYMRTYIMLDRKKITKKLRIATVKVRELIKKLQEIDSELDVICYTEDERLLSSQDVSRVLSIEDISVDEGLPNRSNGGVARIKWRKSKGSQCYAVVTVTGDL